MAFTLFTRGGRELAAAFADVKVKTPPELGRALSAAAGPVKASAQRYANADDSRNARTVGGIRIRRKGTVVRVEQGQSKTTGFHAQYGAYQQTHFFDPALAENQTEVMTVARAAVDALVARVNRLP